MKEEAYNISALARYEDEKRRISPGKERGISEDNSSFKHQKDGTLHTVGCKDVQKHVVLYKK